MAADGLDCTPNSSRYLAAPAIASGGSYTFATPSPFSSVATPATAWLAWWIGAPPHVLPDAPGQQAEAHDGEQADDADHQDPRRALLPGRARLGFGADQELARHD